MNTFVAKWLIETIFNITSNLGLTIVLLGLFLCLFRIPLIVLSKKINVKNNLKNININVSNLEEYDNTLNQFLNIFKSQNIFYIISIFIYFFVYYLLNIQIFILLLNPYQINGIQENVKYSFLFIDDLLFREKTILLPILSSIIMFLSSNIGKLKERINENAILCGLKIAIWALLFSIYGFMFGQIYLLYMLSKSIFNLIMNVIVRIIRSH